MCVSQFRDYCKASEFRHTGRNEDLHNKDIEVKSGTTHYNGRNYHYITDRNKLKQLAKLNNEYAIHALANKA